jgi:hypothetical protein
MSKRASNADRCRVFCKGLLRGAAAAALGTGVAIFAAGAAAAQAPVKDGIPALASMNFAWLALGVDWLDPPLAQGSEPAPGDGLCRKQRRSFRQEPVPDPAGRNAGLLNTGPRHSRRGPGPIRPFVSWLPSPQKSGFSAVGM